MRLMKLGLAVVMAGAPWAMAQGVAAAPAVVAGVEKPAFPRPSPGGEVAAPALRWPARFGFSGPGVQGVCVDVESQFTPVAARDGMGFVVDEQFEPAVTRIRAAAGVQEPVRVSLEGPGSFCYHLPRQGGKQDRNIAAMTFKFVSAREVASAEGEKARTVAVDRTWFCLYEPAAEPKGAVLLMPGMIATPPGTLNAMTRTLLADGWAVLRMLSQPARFNEVAEFKIDPAQDLAAQMKGMAALTDERSAEVAYAAQAAWLHVEEARPKYTALSKAIVGFSAGSLTAPVVIARDPGRYKAQVHVGGGADFFLIVEHCVFKGVTGVSIEWVGGRPDIETFERASAAYLASTCLDGYHLAADAGKVPALMYIAENDDAVPAAMGNLLWERMGRPERVLLPELNHAGLFVAMQQHFGHVREFLDAHR
ncbi:MAG: hypothetical protein JSR77_16915 [Planctomycetes bacterium]|nr:hypothetical protein [Planctomycetota bacterium]